MNHFVQFFNLKNVNINAENVAEWYWVGDADDYLGEWGELKDDDTKPLKIWFDPEMCKIIEAAQSITIQICIFIIFNLIFYSF